MFRGGHNFFIKRNYGSKIITIYYNNNYICRNKMCVICLKYVEGILNIL